MDRFNLRNNPKLALAKVYVMQAIVGLGATEAIQDLKLHRSYLAGEMRDPTLDLTFSLAGWEEVVQCGVAEDGPPLDSSQSHFLGKRLKNSQLTPAMERLDGD